MLKTTQPPSGLASLQVFSGWNHPLGFSEKTCWKLFHTKGVALLRRCLVVFLSLLKNKCCLSSFCPCMGYGVCEVRELLGRGPVLLPLLGSGVNLGDKCLPWMEGYCGSFLLWLFLRQTLALYCNIAWTWAVVPSTSVWTCPFAYLSLLLMVLGTFT